MFYSTEIFVKKGPLGLIWYASHVREAELHRNRRKILSSNVVELCENITTPPVVLALPTQSALLRGVVKIENEQVETLNEEANDTLKRFSFTAKQQKAKSMQLLSDAVLKQHRKDISYNEADINLLLDEAYDFNLDHLYDALDAADDRQLIGRTEETFDMMDTAEEHIRRHPQHPRIIDELTQTPSSMEYSDIELARERAITRGVSLRDELSLGTDIDLQLDTIPGADEEMFIEPISMVPLTPDAEARRDEQFAGMEIPAMPIITAKAKRAAKLSKIILDVETELSDTQIASQLRRTDDLLVTRPLMPTPAEQVKKSIRDILRQPMSIELLDINALPEDMREHYARHATLPSFVQPSPVETVAEYGLEATDYRTGEDLSLSLGTEEYSEFESARQQQYAAEIVPPMFLGRRIERAEQLEARQRRLTEPPEPIELLPTPVIEEEATPSEFEIPVRHTRRAHQEPSVAPTRPARQEITRLTEFFRRELEGKFLELEAAHPDLPPQELEIEFDELLIEIGGQIPSKRDRGIAFYQLLLLKSLDIIQTRQKESYAEIWITRGPRWDVHFSESQMFSVSQV